ncbi:HotDog domain-containing protein [Pilobolus umbonatus]|nr:HotDog domain-containing protein [Pilobolus umbonatus]
MTIKSHPNKVVFESDQTSRIVEIDENIDFSQKMADAVDVQMIDTNLYASKELWLPFQSRGAYGGQIVAQALKAAWDTVDDAFFIHSLHAYFILACNVEYPVIYNIERTRDGRSFSTRIVRATQKGKVIFICSSSFAKPDENVTLNHQIPMPDIPRPEQLPSHVELLKNALDKLNDYPEIFLRRMDMSLNDNQPIEYREGDPYTPEEIATGNLRPDTTNHLWFKSKGTLNDDMKLHACAIAYASDSGFVNTAAKANGVTYNSDNVGMMTSLDHTIWFHMPTRADEWLLHDMHSPRTSDGRGVAFGRIYNLNGDLVATTAQEGIIRLTEKGQEKIKNNTDIDYSNNKNNSIFSKL